MLSCSSENYGDTFGPILVQIDSKKLYASEIKKLIHKSASTYDSSAIANAYIDRWIKDKLMIREAQKYFSTDFEIEALVEDYRNQMIRYRYEQQIIEDKLYTAISANDLLEYYNDNKTNYILIETIYKIIYAVIPASQEKIDRFYHAFVNDDFDYIIEFCLDKSDTSFLQIDTWLSAEKVSAIVPKKLIENKTLSIDKIIQKNIDKKEYFFKVLDIREVNDTIPLELMQETLRRLMLHERKLKVIEDYKQELYEKGIRSKIVKLEIN